MHGFHVREQYIAGSGRNRPADSPTRNEIRLGKSVEGDHRNVLRQGRNRDVLRAGIKDQLVVNLIGEDNQAVPASKFKNLLQGALRVDRAGRIVGVDQQDGLGARVDLAFYVGDVRLPAVVFVQIIGVDRAVQLGHDG